MAELICVPNKNSGTLHKSKYQEMRDIFEIMKRERRMCLNKRMILHAISKCLSEDTDLSNEIKNKVERLLLAVEVNTSMTLNTRHSEETLLGLADICYDDFSFNEQEMLRHAINKELKLIEGATTTNISTQMQIPDDSDLFRVNAKDKSLFDTQEKLQDLKITYMENLKNMYDLLQEFLLLRFNNVKDIIENKVDEYSMKSKMYSLRSDIFKQKINTDIFNENSISIQAYEKLVNDILEQQSECQKQIDDLTELKEKYKLVTCREYDEILKSYLQYISTLEKKKDLYKQLTHK